MKHRNRLPVILSLALAYVTAGCPDGGGGSPTTNDYPIILAHGLLGTESFELGGYELLDYWYGITEAMEDEGAQVFVTEVSPVNSSMVRGAQLLTQVEDIIAITGKPKVHIIGHSQGGFDARYVSGMRPDLVRSVTTVGTPHQGAGIAGFLADHIDEDGSISGTLLSFFGNLLEDFATLITGSDDPVDWREGFRFLIDVDGFNTAFPAGLPAGCHDGPHEQNGVRFYSWTGDIVGPLGIRITTNILDPTDLLFNTSSLFYGLFEDNDGFVPVCSAQFGEVIGDGYLMNHIDQINLLFGLVSPIETNPKTLYRNQVGRLLDLTP